MSVETLKEEDLGLKKNNPASSYRLCSEISVYVLPPSDVVVVGRPKSIVLSPAEKRMVVRSISPPEASGRVL